MSELPEEEHPEQYSEGNLGSVSPNDPDALLDQVENDLTGFELYSERAKVFKLAAELLRARGRDEEGQRAEWRSWLFDFMLVSREARQEQGHGRFAPMIEMGRRVYPHVSAFPPVSLLAFKADLDGSRNPIHRALYADFIWDQREKYPGPKTDPPKAAKVAIDAYLESATLYRQSNWDDQLADAVDRASELALSIRDDKRIEHCKQECFRLARELINSGQHPPVRWAIDVLTTIQGFGRHLSHQEHVSIISLAEAGANFYEQRKARNIQRSFHGLAATSYVAIGEVDQARHARILQAETYVAEADEATSAIARLHILGEALDAYQRLGDSEKMDGLKHQLSQAGLDAKSEMKTVSVRVRIPTEIAEAWVMRLLTLDLDAALEAMGGTDRFVPTVQQVREQAERQRQQFPVAHLVSRKTLDSAGRIVQKAVSDEEQVAASEADVYKVALSAGGWELGLAFDRLESDKSLTAKTFMSYLRFRPIFDPASLAIVAVGVERYFAGDYVSALHILVPQLEDIFRDILAKMGISRVSVQQGLTREKPLDVVLATPQLRSALGEDLATFFEQLLIRSESVNLRHRAAHGLLKIEHCDRETSRWVLLCYLQLGNLAIAPMSEAPGQASSTDEPEAG